MPIIHFYSPSLCAACHRECERAGFCRSCHEKALRSALSAEHRCRKCFSLTENGECSFCKSRFVFFDSHISLFRLEHVWHRLLSRWKFQNDRNCYKILLPFIDSALTDFENTEPFVPVYIASGRPGTDIRAYQPVHDLYRHVSKRLNMKGGAYLIKKDGKKQSSQSYSNRFFAIHDSIGLTKEFVRNQSFLLLEDVFTTGATANEAARSLKNAGAQKVYLLSLFYRERSFQYYGSDQENRRRSGADTRSIGVASARRHSGLRRSA